MLVGMQQRSELSPHKGCMGPDVEDTPTEVVDHVVLRAVPVSQLLPITASPSPYSATWNGLAMGRSDLGMVFLQCLGRLGIDEPHTRSSGPTGLRVICSRCG